MAPPVMMAVAAVAAVVKGLRPLEIQVLLGVLVLVAAMVVRCWVVA
jgi:hypothetical protein